MSDNKADGFRNRLMRSSRAKSHTVMLTPEIAAQVRAATLGDDNSVDEVTQPTADFMADGFVPLGVDASMHATGRHEGLGQHDYDWEDRSVGVGRRDAEFSESPLDEVSSPEVRIFQVPEENPYPSWSGGERSQPNFTKSRSSGGDVAEHSLESLNNVLANATQRGCGVNLQKVNSKEEVMSPGSVRVVVRGAATKLAGFLITFDVDPNGEVCELRQGRWILSSRISEDGGSIVVNDESISPLHAIVRVTNDHKIQVLDQLSEYGTGVLRAGSDEEYEVVGAMVNLEHGDRVRFGKRYFYVCLLQSMDY